MGKCLYYMNGCQSPSYQKTKGGTVTISVVSIKDELYKDPNTRHLVVDSNNRKISNMSMSICKGKYESCPYSDSGNSRTPKVKARKPTRKVKCICPHCNKSIIVEIDD